MTIINLAKCFGIFRVQRIPICEFLHLDLIASIVSRQAVQNGWLNPDRHIEQSVQYS